VRFRYMAVPVKQALPSLPGLLIRHRPVVAARLTGPRDTSLLDGLLDTGADDTVIEDWHAQYMGVDLTQAPELQITLAGRPQAVRCRYAPVQLRLTDGNETFEWTAAIGFVSGHLHYCLWGQAGFLQFFQADFDGEGHVVTLTPKHSFPGTSI
jgi:hypothetical protein